MTIFQQNIKKITSDEIFINVSGDGLIEEAGVGFADVEDQPISLHFM